MIAGIFFEGSGLGDQLFRYITIRTLAEEKGFAWGMMSDENFKGDFFKDFKSLSKNIENSSVSYVKALPEVFRNTKFLEKDLRDEFDNDIRSYDPEINFVVGKTLIDGSFEDSKYWHHNLKNIDEWLRVVPVNVPDNRCIIGFRGGEYATYPDLILPKGYYQKAIKQMLAIDPNMEFEVHTDDPVLALTYFPDYPIIDNRLISHSKHTNMGYNWRCARYAKYAIIPNSAFFILPRLLKHFWDPKALTIAPRYWAGHNQKVWKRPACYYPEFIYIHGTDSD